MFLVRLPNDPELCLQVLQQGGIPIWSDVAYQRRSDVEGPEAPGQKAAQSEQSCPLREPLHACATDARQPQ